MEQEHSERKNVEVNLGDLFEKEYEREKFEFEENKPNSRFLETVSKLFSEEDNS